MRIARRPAISSPIARAGAAIVSALLLVLVLVLALVHAPAPRPALAQERAGSAPAAVARLGRFESVPVGIAIAQGGRTFLAFSRAIDPSVPLSVAEWKAGGRPRPFPPGFRQDEGEPAPERLLSVQAVTVDARDRLWILDCAKVGDRPVPAGAAKLVCVDLARGEAVRTIAFPAEVAGPTSFLNDVRVDLSRGRAGVAFITDAAPEGPNAIVVVDLATGEAARRLEGHASVQPDAAVTLRVEGQPLLERAGEKAGKPFRAGADGIALSSDGYVYYCPLASRKLYRVPAGVLADAGRGAEELAAYVEDLGEKGFAADGLLEDAQGRVYLTDFEDGAIHRRTADGQYEVVARGPDLAWPDTLALRADGTLVCTVTQIQRMARFAGEDRRARPFWLCAVATDSRPFIHDVGSPGGTLFRRER